MVMNSPKQIVRILATCAAFVAQLAPQAFCLACDQPCCIERSSGRGLTKNDAGVEPVSHCPLCAAAADFRPTETHERPCRCQLNARHDQPLSPTKGTLLELAGGDVALGPAVAPPEVPQLLGVSREYLAASLAVPIRPPRILFGVWRN